MAEAGRGSPAPPPPRGAAGPSSDPDVLVLVMVLGRLGRRLLALFVSPLELYPDEAQYWVWSRSLDLGYFSKPPLIAWTIRATTELGGQAEAWVRLSAPVFHAVAALALAQAGRRLYGPWSGFGAALVYCLMPGVQLSSAVIATDAPLMAFLSLAVWAYAVFITDPSPSARRRAAAALGAALGLAMLAKYAGAYVVAGLALHALASRSARRRWTPATLLLAFGLAFLVLAPNLGWNLANGLSTLSHTAEAADLGGPGRAGPPPRSLLDPRQAPGFLLSQFGVFGPIPFTVLLIGTGLLFLRRPGPVHGHEPAEGREQDVMLLCLAAPALLVALAEAAVARANANWAAAAYAAGSVLVGAWLVRWRARRALAATVATQGAVAALFLVAFAHPALVDRLGLGNSVKQARGWQAATRAVLERAAAAPRPDAIAADDRFLYNALAYYGRDAFGRPGAGAPPLRMWVRETRAHNEAEASAPLGAGDGRRVLVASMSYPAEAADDFARFERPERKLLRLDAKRSRALYLFDGLAFEKKPRDDLTRRPVKPACVARPAPWPELLRLAGVCKPQA